MNSKRTTNWRGSPLLLAIGLAAGLASHAAQADLINTDFSAGFSGWEAEVTYYNYAENESFTQSGDVFGQYPGNFSVQSDSASLFTTMDQDNDYWSVTMYQETQLSALNINDSLTFSLDVSASLTDTVSDFFFVQLRDLSTDDVIDMSMGGSFDISEWAGKMVSFEFGVIDNDFVLNDSLTVRNIDLTVASVPAPASGLLVALGFVVLARRK